MASWRYFRRIGVQLTREKLHFSTVARVREPRTPSTVIWKEITSPSYLSSRHFSVTSHNNIRCPSLLSSQQLQQQQQQQQPPSVQEDLKQQQQKPESSPADDQDYLDMSPEEIHKLTYFQRFKKMGKQYGVILVPFHLATSFMWYGSFYFASKSGVDLLPVLEWIGVGESVKIKLSSSNASHYILAYALYKVITPLRYTTTIAGTTLTARFLRRQGWMQKHPKDQTLKEATRQLTDKAKVRVKDKAVEMKDRTSGAVKDKAEEIKGALKDKATEMKVRTTGAVKDKAEEIKGALKDKASEVREKASSNAKDITQKFKKK